MSYVVQVGKGILRNRRKFCPHKPPATETTLEFSILIQMRSEPERARLLTPPVCWDGKQA